MCANISAGNRLLKVCVLFLDYNFISIHTHTFNFKIMCVCVSVCACKCRCLWGPDVAYEFSGTRDADSCELSDMVMGIKARPSTSCVLSLLSRPLFSLRTEASARNSAGDVAVQHPAHILSTQALGTLGWVCDRDRTAQACWLPVSSEILNPRFMKRFCLKELVESDTGHLTLFSGLHMCAQECSPAHTCHTCLYSHTQIHTHKSFFFKGVCLKWRIQRDKDRK